MEANIVILDFKLLKKMIKMILITSKRLILNYHNINILKKTLLQRSHPNSLNAYRYSTYWIKNIVINC